MARAAIVTGGARGIGAAIAARLRTDGRMVVVGDVGAPAVAIDGVRYETADVTDELDMTRLVATATEVGDLDVVVHNAGIWFPKPFMEITPEEWHHVLHVNLDGAYHCIRAAVPVLEARGGGSIVLIGSQAGVTVTRGQGAHYHASKAAISHLAKVLAFELGSMGIRINCVAPGATPADPSQFPAPLVAQIPLGRVGRPGDMAAACAYLVSDDAAFVTGQTLLVNGGAVGFV
jgi:NAD(P)-dependent dehydrogenase (short-subunit alcohol dehydrogenase family)